MYWEWTSKMGDIMKAGMVLGIIGGVIGLIIGAFGFGAASIGNSLSDATSAGVSFSLYKYGSILAPLACLAGAGLATTKPPVGAILMAASAVAMVLIFGFHMFSLVSVILAGLGAALVFIDIQKAQQQPDG